MPSTIHVHPGVNLSAIIRRYIGLTKLVDLLSSGDLYFPRADGFADRLEGAMFTGLRDLIDAAARAEGGGSADEYYRKVRTCNYVSCWTAAEEDSMALWNLAAPDHEVVALVTTTKKLREVAGSWGRDVHLYSVQYIDHSKPPNYALFHHSDLLQYKHRAFAFESEVRFVIPHHTTEPSLQPDGLRMPVADLSTILDRIDVHPICSPMFLKAVEAVCTRFNLSVPVQRSKLASVPV